MTHAKYAHAGGDIRAGSATASGSEAWSAAALLAAWQRLAPRLERHGFDASELDRLKANARAYCGALSAHIQAGTYRPQPLQPVSLRKRDGGQRLLLVPPIADRLVQGALAQALSERLDRSFNDASYAYRPGRGVQRAAARVRHELRQPGAGWVLDADIRQCFDLILHAPLVEALRQRDLWHDRTAWLLKAYLRAEVPPHAGQGPYCLARGLPQGSPLSPLLCNLALDRLDGAFEAAGIAFVRFADDFVAFAADESAAMRLREMAASVLAPLGLELHPDKTAVRPASGGFEFLGQVFEPSPTTPQQAMPRPPPPTDPEQPEAAQGSSPVVPLGEPAEDCRIETQEVAPSPVVLDAGPPVTPEAPPTTPTTPTTPTAPTAHALPADPQATPAPDAEADDAPLTQEPLLRTLYLLERNTHLANEADALVVSVPERPPLKVPIHRLHQVLAFGDTSLSSGAIALCLQNAVPVMILSGRGRYFGVIDPLRIDSMEVQREQFRAFDDSTRCLRLAVAFVEAKIANSLQMLRRWHRRRPVPGAAEVFDRLHLAQANARRAEDLAALRGVEGAAAAAYWKSFGELLPAHWQFDGRKRRPAPDPVNSMLSYGYTVLYYNVLTLIMARGLNAHLGFFHRPGSGHHALASDLMEEFRAPVVDALVFDMAANHRVRLEDFTWPEATDEPCLMSAHARRTFIHAFERKMNSTLQHPQFGVVLDYRRVIDGQVLQLVNTLRGHAETYIPFMLKS